MLVLKKIITLFGNIVSNNIIIGNKKYFKSKVYEGIIPKNNNLH